MQKQPLHLRLRPKRQVPGRPTRPPAAADGHGPETLRLPSLLSLLPRSSYFSVSVWLGPRVSSCGPAAEVAIQARPAEVIAQGPGFSGSRAEICVLGG